MIMEQSALSVSQLNFFVKAVLESEPRLRRVTVAGEISNFVSHYKTGHLYFSLKDAAAAVKVVMFRSDAAKLNFRPENGAAVLVTGRIAVYERDGVYQLYAEKMTPAGAGALAEAYERLKKKLTAEGLFDASKKRPVPRYPARIGVITSRSGAAVRDIFNVLSRRWPAAQITLYPVLVQGIGAAASVAAAVEKANALGRDDVLIVGRGGGSAEDLWAFNEEILVRAVASSAIPVVSAVGHETDFTLCDFAADLRAPTPSAAAELCAPDAAEERERISLIRTRLTRAVRARLDEAGKELLRYGGEQGKNRIMYIISGGMQYIDSLDSRMTQQIRHRLQSAEAGLRGGAAALENLSPLKVLARGYAVCEKGGVPVRDIAEIDAGDTVTLRLNGGTADCSVTEKRMTTHE